MSKTRGSRQRVSVVETESNPLSSGGKSGGVFVKIENLSGAKLINQEELQSLIDLIDALEDNDMKLRMIEFNKTPHLFSSASLMKILKNIDSIKTKLEIIESLGPRLTDPKLMMSEFLDLFRYADEKEKVEEVLKARATTQTAGQFNQLRPQSLRSGPGSPAAGRGGRGNAVRKLSDSMVMIETPPKQLAASSIQNITLHLSPEKEHVNSIEEEDEEIDSEAEEEKTALEVEQILVAIPEKQVDIVVEEPQLLTVKVDPEISRTLHHSISLPVKKPQSPRSPFFSFTRPRDSDDDTDSDGEHHCILLKRPISHKY